MEHYLNRKIDYLQPSIANAYDELPFWSAPFAVLLLKEMPMIRQGRVLDIGSGTGFPLTVLAARLGPQVQLTGLDPWDAGRARAQQRVEAYGLENVTLIPGSADALPFPDGHFDLITANLVLNNIDDAPAMFRECMRVLKPGAHLCITTNLVGTFQEVYNLLTEAMAHLHQPEALHEIARHAAARRTPLQVAELFHHAGFVDFLRCEVDHACRWADGSAFLNDPLIVMGFLPGWMQLVPQEQHNKVFAFVERTLDAWAEQSGSVTLRLPIMYAEGRKPLS